MKPIIKPLLSLAVCSAFLAGTLCACGTPGASGGSSLTQPTQATADTTVTDALMKTVEASSVPAPDATNATTIAFSGSDATITGNGAAVENGVVTITSGGVYVCSGTLTEGRILVQAPKEDVTLVLDNANVTCSYGSPIYIYQSSQTTVYLPDGTQSTLTDGSSYTFADALSSAANEEPNACLYSKSNLVIAGGGALTVNGSYNNGITSKDTLQIEAAALTVNAKNHGINGKDSLTVKGASLNVVSGGDALRSTNNTDTSLGYFVALDSALNLQSGEDGIQAETALAIQGGSCTIVSGGGSNVTLDETVSAKGIKAGGALTLYSGTYELNCADDAVHTNASAVISGGDYTISTGDDGMHADETMTVAAGNIAINECYEGMEGSVVNILNGNINIAASDDGINAAGGAGETTQQGFRKDQFNAGSSDCAIHISGGTVSVRAGGDGLDSNGDLTISGGDVTVWTSNRADEQPLDTDGQISITGGTVFAAGGSAGMGMNLTAEQPYVVLGSGMSMGGGRGGGRRKWQMGADGSQGTPPQDLGSRPEMPDRSSRPERPQGTESFPEGEPPTPPTGSDGQPQTPGMGGTVSVSAGSTLTIQDSSGNTVYTAEAPFDLSHVFYCAPSLTDGSTYTLLADGSTVSELTAAAGSNRQAQ